MKVHRLEREQFLPHPVNEVFPAFSDARNLERITPPLVRFRVVNQDPIDHEWLIGDASFHDAHRTGTHASHGGVPSEVSLPALETVETTITFDEAGTLSYVCHLPAHESYGMVGELIVGG